MVWNQGHGPERDGLDAMNKRDLSERDICTKFITPALLGAVSNRQNLGIGGPPTLAAI